MSTRTRSVAALALVSLAGCGRVEERPTDDGGLPRPDDGGSPGAFACRTSGVTLRPRYALSLDEPGLAARTAGGSVLVATRGTLFHLSRDGTVLHVTRGDDSTRVLDLNALATLALVQHADSVQVVGASGETSIDEGPSSGPSTPTGVIRAAFTESGGLAVFELGTTDLEHESVNRVELRSLDSDDVQSWDGPHKIFVGTDGGVVVEAHGSDVVAWQSDGQQAWSAHYRARVNRLTGARNGRTVLIDSDSLFFGDGADNSALLVVDGNVITVPYLSPAGFSPGGTYVASGQLGTLTMRRGGAEIWRAAITPELLVDSVSVNDDGRTLVSGTSRKADAGSKPSGHALLYDAMGTLLAHCERPDIEGALYSGYSYEGDAFMLYGGVGVVGYDLR